MKKARKNVLIVLVLMLIAGTVFANTSIEELTDDVEVVFDFEDAPNELEEGVDSRFEEDFSYENEESYTDEFDTDNNNWEEGGEAVILANSLAAAVDMVAERENSFQMIREIASFEEEYNMDINTRKQLEQWIAEGKDYRLLMYIYEFWTTTNEDLSIIGDVYDMFVRNYDDEMRLPNNRALWFEGIFNKLTDNKFGKIKSDDIDRYMGAGLSLSDINMAERISRAGVKNVHEILDERANDKTWISIVAEIYDMPELLSYPELDIISLQDVLTLSRITGETADVIITKAENSSIDELMDQHLAESQRKADNALIIAGLWKFNTQEEKSMVMAAVSKGIEPVVALGDAKLAIANYDKAEVQTDNNRHPAEESIELDELEELQELEEMLEFEELEIDGSLGGGR